ncbi:MAG: hypothetical protein EA426_01880 [Spirochaetaceae bacterium]|nr:MAG: hypothetical protein EA426_01880 [Spirochaetaceae bacterium]
MLAFDVHDRLLHRPDRRYGGCHVGLKIAAPDERGAYGLRKFTLREEERDARAMTVGRDFLNPFSMRFCEAVVVSLTRGR